MIKHNKWLNCLIFWIQRMTYIVFRIWGIVKFLWRLGFVSLLTFFIVYVWYVYILCVHIHIKSMYTYLLTVYSGDLWRGQVYILGLRTIHRYWFLLYLKWYQCYKMIGRQLRLIITNKINPESYIFYRPGMINDNCSLSIIFKS